MNKRLKRLAATVLTLVMLVSVFAAQMITSYAAAGKITFSDHNPINMEINRKKMWQEKI